MPPTVKISTLSGFRIRERYVRGSDDGFTEQQAAKVELLKELTAASTAGNHVALRRLLKQPSADANYRPRGPTGPALLHLAAASGDDRSCELLCIHGARVNAKYGVHGNTALHDAARADHAAACAALIRCHADTSAKNNVGWTALHWASSSAAAQSTEALLRGGAIAALDAPNRGTAIDVARRPVVVSNILRPRLYEPSPNSSRLIHFVEGNTGIARRTIAIAKSSDDLANDPDAPRRRRALLSVPLVGTRAKGERPNAIRPPPSTRTWGGISRTRGWLH